MGTTSPVVATVESCVLSSDSHLPLHGRRRPLDQAVHDRCPSRRFPIVALPNASKASPREAAGAAATAEESHS